MSKIFFKRITIANYKCFANQVIELKCPDNTTEGSGLNIIIGENANGKTTILDAINFITLSSFSAENKLSIHDIANLENEISIKGEIEEFNCKMPYPGNYFECNGIEFKARSRDRKSPGRLLSSQFQINNYFLNRFPNYKNSRNEDSGNEIKSLYKIYNPENIIDGDLNVFLFDKNRTRQISTGTFRTTFDRICEDLNWKFVKNIDTETKQKLVENIVGEYFKAVYEISQKGAGEKLAKALKEFFSNEEYEKLKIELLDLLHPFTTAFFALRENDDLKQVKTSELGSGIEMILTLLLLNSISRESGGSIIYLIDEPELHLHPLAQEKLIQLLLKESKDKQIIISTHSPYIFKNCLHSNVGLIIASRNAQRNIVLEYPNVQGWGHFPWSPSWGEINFFAFGLATVELHNELYGYIQEKTQNWQINTVDSYLNGKGLPKSKAWIKLSNGTPQPAINYTLPTYIRNSIHHPENTHNTPFTQQELADSIRQLISLWPI